MSHARDHKEQIHDDMNAKLGTPSTKVEAPLDSPCRLCDVDFKHDPKVLISTTEFQAWECPECGRPIYVQRGHAPWCFHVLGRCVLDAVGRFGEKLTIDFSDRCGSTPGHGAFHLEAEK